LIKDLAVSSLLITDWSGIALEFSLGLKKPTISINTPQKIRNAHYKEEIYQTYEKLIREKIGAIHSGPIDSKLLELIEKVLENRKSQDFKQNLEKELNRVYNIGNSDSIGSELIESIFLQNSLNVNAEKSDPSIY
jgi:YidC/Oxa1 family membrane protein insertase